MAKKVKSVSSKTFKERFSISMKYEKLLYLMAIPAVVWFIFFHYLPFYGLQIAFKDYSPFVGIWDSKWVGLDNFEYIFFGAGQMMFLRALKNTIILNLYGLIFEFPVPILLALLFNEVRSDKFRKFSQTVLYLPHFISQLVVCGLAINLLSPTGGLINNILVNLNIIAEPIYFMVEPEYYRTIYTGTGIWKNAGFDSIIFFAALLGISPSLYEAAKMDGTNKFQEMWHITLPGIAPTVVIMFILRVGSIINASYEKTLLLYLPQTYEVSDVLGSYIYRIGLQSGTQMDVAAAAGLFNSVVALMLVTIANTLAKKLGGSTLW